MSKKRAKKNNRVQNVDQQKNPHQKIIGRDLNLKVYLTY